MLVVNVKRAEGHLAPPPSVSLSTASLSQVRKERSSREVVTVFSLQPAGRATSTTPGLAGFGVAILRCRGLDYRFCLSEKLVRREIVSVDEITGVSQCLLAIRLLERRNLAIEVFSLSNEFL